MGVALPRTMRASAYFFTIGVVAGLLLAGVLVPLLFGESLSGGTADVAAGRGGRSSGSVGGTAGETSSADRSAGGGGEGPATAVPGQSVSSAAGGRGAAGGAPGLDGAKAGAGASAPGEAAEAATEVGVSDTAMRVGFLLLDLGSANRAGLNIGVGIVDPEQQREAFQVIIDEINGRGGIHGRQIEPVYRSFDVLNEEDMRAKCIELTEEERVFVVVAQNSYSETAALCVAEEHGTPLVGVGFYPTEFFERTGGRLFSGHQSSARLMRNWVSNLDGRRLLKGTKIGILGDEGNSRIASNDLEAALAEANYDVTYRSRLSRDLQVAQSQIPLEVQRMRQAGVDTVFLTTSLFNSQPFVQNADKQGWHPTYFASDWQGQSTDTATQNMPDSYHGTLGIMSTIQGEWRIGEPEPAPAVACRTRYEQATGKTLERNNSSPYNITMTGCALATMFEKGAQGAGPTLTRDTFVAGLEGVGSLAIPYWFGGGFAPGKHDAADLSRAEKWFRDCKCWKPTEPPRPVAH